MKRNTRHRLTMAEVRRQVDETRARGRRVLPKSWWDPAVQERMSEWIEQTKKWQELAA